MRDLIISSIIGIFVYDKYLSFSEKRKIRRMEKQTNERINMLKNSYLWDEKYKEKALEFYNLYKTIDFKNQWRWLQSELLKILFDYVWILNSIHTQEWLIGATFGDERDIWENFNEISVLEKKGKKIETLLKNLLSYVKDKNNEDNENDEE
jgi:hypothetical protein